MANVVINARVESRDLLRKLALEKKRSMVDVLHDALEQYANIDELRVRLRLRLMEELYPVLEEASRKVLLKLVDEEKRKPWLKREDADDIEELSVEEEVVVNS